jgi:hypothetical protein
LREQNDHQKLSESSLADLQKGLFLGINGGNASLERATPTLTTTTQESPSIIQVPPLPYAKRPNLPIANLPTHQSQGWQTHGRRHPPHLAIAAFSYRQPQPTIGHALAKAHWGVAGPKVRRVNTLRLRGRRHAIL